MSETNEPKVAEVPPAPARRGPIDVDALLSSAKSKLLRRELEIEHLGIVVVCRELDGNERYDIVSPFAMKAKQGDISAEDLKSYYADVVLAGVEDPATGAPLFKAEHRDRVLSLGSAALEAMVGLILSLSGVQKEALVAEKKGS